MTQALYAHMNNKTIKIKKKTFYFLCVSRVIDNSNNYIMCVGMTNICHMCIHVYIIFTYLILPKEIKYYDCSHFINE
jgi:hypothetical protein